MPPCRRVIPFSHHHTATVCVCVCQPDPQKRFLRFRINKNMFVVDSIRKLRLHTLADGDRDWQNNNKRVSSVAHTHTRGNGPHTDSDRFSSIWRKNARAEIHLDDLKCVALSTMYICHGTFPIRLAALQSGVRVFGGASSLLLSPAHTFISRIRYRICLQRIIGSAGPLSPRVF